MDQDDVEKLSYLLFQSVNLTELDIEQVQHSLQQIEAQPTSVLLYLDVILYNENTNIKFYAATNLYRFFRCILSRCPNEIIEKFKIKLLQALINVLDVKTRFMIIEICSLIFKLSCWWNEFIVTMVNLFQNHDFVTPVLMLHSVISYIPGGNIIEFTGAFLKIAIGGLGTNDIKTIIKSSKIIFLLCKLSNNYDFAEQIIESHMNALENYKGLEFEDLLHIWFNIEKLFKHTTLQPELIDKIILYSSLIFSEENISSDNRVKIISCLLPMIPTMRDDIVISLVNVSIELSLTYIHENEALPSDFIDFISKILSVRQELLENILLVKIQQLLSQSDPIHITLGIYLLGPLINSSLLSFQNNSTFQTAIVNAFNLNHNLPILAALDALEGINETSLDLKPLAESVIGKCLLLLSSEDEMVRKSAYNTCQSLIETMGYTNSEIFHCLWQYHISNHVLESEKVNFIHLLATVIEYYEDIPDDTVRIVFEYAKNIVNEVQDEIVRAATLNLLCVLIINEESLIDILSNLSETVMCLLNFENDEVLINVLSFLRNISIAYREKVVDFVSKYFDKLDSFLRSDNEGTRVYDYTVYTSAIIIKYLNNTTLLPSLRSSIISLFNSDSSEVLIDACDAVREISLFLNKSSENPVEMESNIKAVAIILDKLVQICYNEVEIELLQMSLESLGVLYKHCYTTNISLFDEKYSDLIHSIFLGNIRYLNGTSLLDIDIPVEFVQFLTQFITDVITTNGLLFDECLNFMVEWIEKRQDNAPVIIGSIASILELRQIPMNILEIIVNIVSKNIDSYTIMHQNIISFFSRSLRMVPQLSDTYSKFLKLLNQWLNSESESLDTKSNVASFLLLIKVDDQSIVNALKYYPPHDLSESSFMSESLIRIYTNDNTSSISDEIAFALARLFTENQSNLNKREISEELLNNLVSVFREIVMHNHQIANRILAHYDRYPGKQAKLSALLN